MEECPAGRYRYTVVARVVRGRCSVSRAAVAVVVELCCVLSSCQCHCGS